MSVVEFLKHELRRLDLLLRCEILRVRARYQPTVDELRGLYVSDEHVDALVRERSGDVAGTLDLERQAEELRLSNARSRPAQWQLLQSRFHLSPFEQDVILLAVAREIDLKYETIFAYLHNDVTRKHATVELALRVLRNGSRNAFLPEATLFGKGLLTAAAESAPSFAGREISLSPVLIRHLTGLPPESSIPSVSSSAPELLLGTVSLPRLYVVETGDTTATRGMLESACCEARFPLLNIDLQNGSLPDLAHRIQLVQSLENCGVCLYNGSVILAAQSAPPEVRRFFEVLSEPVAPIWVFVEPRISWQGIIPGSSVRVIRVPAPTVKDRYRIWTEALPGVTTTLARSLASRYSLSRTQIHGVARAAQDILTIRGEDRSPGWDEIADAVRYQSESSVGQHAQRLVCRQTWDDLVLPAGTLRQIREVAGAIRLHHVVYTDWGFGDKHRGIEGLKILFAGASGTGKTMTAGVIGNDLKLEVFRVELSGVVSKYIGETEKNLDRIFNAARGSNAILFFDEADALFGKRSEVKDAHDRYANIEVAYLLQKFEEHDGTVILATNLRSNLDDAFSRRMHYAIEFPQPDKEHRLALWQQVFPKQAPLAQDLDLEFVANQFPITGGDIRNVALDAAFLAAQNGGVITMRQITAAMTRQLVKQGRPPAAVDFKQYHALMPSSGIPVRKPA